MGRPRQATSGGMVFHLLDRAKARQSIFVADVPDILSVSTPPLAALEIIGYGRRMQTFVHPGPRGITILPTTEQVTAQINRARRYLAACLAKA